MVQFKLLIICLLFMINDNSKGKTNGINDSGFRSFKVADEKTRNFLTCKLPTFTLVMVKHVRVVQTGNTDKDESLIKAEKQINDILTAKTANV